MSLDWSNSNLPLKLTYEFNSVLEKPFTAPTMTVDDSSCGYTLDYMLKYFDSGASRSFDVLVVTDHDLKNGWASLNFADPNSMKLKLNTNQSYAPNGTLI